MLGWRDESLRREIRKYLPPRSLVFRFQRFARGAELRIAHPFGFPVLKVYHLCWHVTHLLKVAALVDKCRRFVALVEVVIPLF